MEVSCGRCRVPFCCDGTALGGESVVEPASSSRGGITGCAESTTLHRTNITPHGPIIQTANCCLFGAECVVDSNSLFNSARRSRVERIRVRRYIHTKSKAISCVGGIRNRRNGCVGTAFSSVNRSSVIQLSYTSSTSKVRFCPILH